MGTSFYVSYFLISTIYLILSTIGTVLMIINLLSFFFSCLNIGYPEQRAGFQGLPPREEPHLLCPKGDPLRETTPLYWKTTSYCLLAMYRMVEKHLQLSEH